MSYVFYNPNPQGLSVGDCTIRAISCALNLSWKRTYLHLALQGFLMYDMPMHARTGGYARMSSKEEMVEELKKMMKETTDEKVRATISETISKMQK